MEKVVLADRLAQFAAHWQPKIIGELNGQQVKLAKFKGVFDWHHHAAEDELFLVIAGSFEMQFRDRTVELATGEMLVVPRGVEHRPFAQDECAVLLFEPTGTLNTGNVVSDRTLNELERL